MSGSKPVIGYWEIRGLVYPCKLALAHLGIEYEDKRYSVDSAGSTEWANDKFNLGLDFPNLPYWIEGGGGGSGVKLTESRAILKYIAREKGSGLLYPSDPAGQRNAEMLENVLDDVWWTLIRRCINDTDNFKNAMTTQAPKKLEDLEKYLGAKKWMLGDELSYVDFICYEVLYQYALYDEATFLKPYPGLMRLKGQFEALPKVSEHIKSPKYIKGPCYHPAIAKYKI